MTELVLASELNLGTRQSWIYEPEDKVTSQARGQDVSLSNLALSYIKQN